MSQFKVGDRVKCVMNGQVLFIATITSLTVTDYEHDTAWMERVQVVTDVAYPDYYESRKLNPVRSLLRLLTPLEELL